MQRLFSQRSDRVKGVDLHPTEPWWVLATELHRPAAAASLCELSAASWNLNAVPRVPAGCSRICTMAIFIFGTSMTRWPLGLGQSCWLPPMPCSQRECMPFSADVGIRLLNLSCLLCSLWSSRSRSQTFQVRRCLPPLLHNVCRWHSGCAQPPDAPEKLAGRSGSTQAMRCHAAGRSSAASGCKACSRTTSVLF